MLYTKEFIQEKLATDVRWLTRGILAIYERQTQDEQKTESTNHTNYRGFTGADAKFLTSLAKYILASKTLSQKQLYCAKKRMNKYAGQLLKVIQEKESQKLKKAC